MPMSSGTQSISVSRFCRCGLSNHPPGTSRPAITQQEARIFQHTRIYRDVEAVVEQLEILARNGDDKQALSDLVEYVHLFAAHPEGSKYALVLREKLLASRRLKGLLEQLEEELGEELG